jgi:heat-inducible transcriptional repressor
LKKSITEKSQNLSHTAKLDERKEAVLRAIIEMYIDMHVPEPIGSRALSKLLNVSAATIRNEMGDLEDMGFLMKPHTSAGRVPTNCAYRYYVDTLMQLHDITRKEINEAKRQLHRDMLEVGELIRSFSIFFSRDVNLPTIVVISKTRGNKIKRIKLFRLGEKNVIVLVMTDSQNVQSKRFGAHEKIDVAFLVKLENTLNQTLDERLFDEINSSHFKAIKANLKDASEEFSDDDLRILNLVLDFVHAVAAKFQANSVYVEGETTLLSFPEYSDVTKAQKMLEFLDEGSVIGEALDCISFSEGEENVNESFSEQTEKSRASPKNVKVIIGDENENSCLKDSSVILTKVKLKNSGAATFGIVGPTRINYPKIVPRLSFFTKELAWLLSQEFE